MPPSLARASVARAAGGRRTRRRLLPPPRAERLRHTERLVPDVARAWPAPAAHPGASADGWRFLRAYTTTFVVIASYVGLAIRTRVLGHSWRQANVGRVHTRNARRVYATILRLQGLFIKVGQLLSIMANFLPDEFRLELEALQDRVPPRPYQEIAGRIESEFGTRMDRFASIEQQPIASASLGQVHLARLIDG